MTEESNNEEETTHEKLVKEYLKYYDANLKFESRHSFRTHRSSRRHLRNIIKLAKERQKEIHNEYAEKRKTKK
jgi:hypothetical protein